MVRTSSILPSPLPLLHYLSPVCARAEAISASEYTSRDVTAISVTRAAGRSEPHSVVPAHSLVLTRVRSRKQAVLHSQPSVTQLAPLYIR